MVGRLFLQLKKSEILIFTEVGAKSANMQRDGRTNDKAGKYPRGVCRRALQQRDLLVGGVHQEMIGLVFVLVLK